MTDHIPTEEIKDAVQRTNHGYLIIKRLSDIILSFIGIVLLLPFLILIAVVVTVYDGKGKPIFSQTRVGKDGKCFSMLKFRTMYPGAEKEYERLASIDSNKDIAVKIRNDPRVTKIGSWLRKTGLDELPQLWNVLKGDMSLV